MQAVKCGSLYTKVYVLYLVEQTYKIYNGMSNDFCLVWSVKELVQF